MANSRNTRTAFTMAELLVCTVIATLAFVFAAPALNKGREGTDRLRCENNLRQLSQAQLAYANAHAGLPPMALSFDIADYRVTQPGPGNWYDGHSWYSLIGPYIGEPEWASLVNLSVSVSSVTNEPMRRVGLRLKIHACPADIGLQKNEWASANWARVGSNYVVNAGNTNYGQTNDVNGDPVVFLGAPFAGGKITPLATITDGVSNTLMMSEVPVLPGCTGWGGAYSEIQSSWGGQVFTGYRGPNPNVADIIGYARNGNGVCGSTGAMNARYIAAGVVPVPISAPPPNSPYQTSIAPRSKHPGGVNATLCDGSAGFITNQIDPTVWRALSTARGGDFVPASQAAPAATLKAK